MMANSKFTPGQEALDKLALLPCPLDEDQLKIAQGWVEKVAVELDAASGLLAALEHVTNSFWIVLYDRGLVVNKDECPDGGHWDSIREANAAIAKAKKIIYAE